MAVASLAEAWIEILVGIPVERSVTVASLAEAWIEIMRNVGYMMGLTSLPLRKRGLKFQ